MTVYGAIKTIAYKNGKSIYRIEKDLDLGNGAVSKWDKSMPSASNLKRVADYLGVTSAFILDKAKEEIK